MPVLVCSDLSDRKPRKPTIINTIGGGFLSGQFSGVEQSIVKNYMNYIAMAACPMFCWRVSCLKRSWFLFCCRICVPAGSFVFWKGVFEAYQRKGSRV